MVQFKEPSDPHGHAVGRAQENLTSTVTDGQLIRDSVQCEDMDQGVSQTVGKIENLGVKIKRHVYGTPGLQNNLWRAIQSNRLPEKPHFQSFLAESQVEKIMNVEAVEQELSRHCRTRTMNFVQRLRTVVGEKRTLAQLAPEARRKLAEQICGELEDRSTTQPLEADALQSVNSVKAFRKILAILTLIGLPHRIQSFVDLGVCDQDLPLQFTRSKERACRGWTLRRNLDSEIPSAVLLEPEWTRHKIAKFEERQWSMLAPSFSHQTGKAVTILDFADNVILPFIFFKSFAQNTGSSCDLFKVQIHPDHHGSHKYESRNSGFFAVKRLKSQDKDVFVREVAVLKRFSDNRPHLISLIGAYKQRSHYHLMFPWAEADLRVFWREKMSSVPSNKREVVLHWMAEQCYGIADGLSQIHSHRTFSGKSLLRVESISKLRHNEFQTQSSSSVSRSSHNFKLFGRHGDIKPENILWFPGPETSDLAVSLGTLKIADFGIAEFSTEIVVDSQRRGFVANSPSYRAPESDIIHDDGIIWVSYSYDIWALGCVFLEFVTWWFGGWRLVEDFRTQRSSPDMILFGQAAREERAFFSDTFFTITKSSGGERIPIVKEGVSEFITYLQDHPRATTFTKAFLQMVTNEMLNAKPHRISSKKVAQALEKMSKDAGWIPYWTALSRTTSPASSSEVPEA